MGTRVGVLVAVACRGVEVTVRVGVGVAVSGSGVGGRVGVRIGVVVGILVGVRVRVNVGVGGKGVGVGVGCLIVTGLASCPAELLFPVFQSVTFKMTPIQYEPEGVPAGIVGAGDKVSTTEPFGPKPHVKRWVCIAVSDAEIVSFVDRYTVTSTAPLHPLDE